jgi:hypothetical protein
MSEEKLEEVLKEINKNKKSVPDDIKVHANNESMELTKSWIKQGPEDLLRRIFYYSDSGVKYYTGEVESLQRIITCQAVASVVSSMTIKKYSRKVLGYTAIIVIMTMVNTLFLIVAYWDKAVSLWDLLVRKLGVIF